MDVRLTWTNCDEAGDYVVPKLSPRDLVSRPDNMEKTVIHTRNKAFTEQSYNEEYMSRVVRKPAFCICENKDADQLRGSTIPLLPKSEISNL